MTRSNLLRRSWKAYCLSCRFRRRLFFLDEANLWRRYHEKDRPGHKVAVKYRPGRRAS